MQKAEEIWVPAAWHVERFAAAGVAPRHGMHVVGEAVETDFFEPAGRRPERRGEPFVFVSIFKLEWRKGWDVLLDAYWREFGPDDNVRLRLKTYLPSWEGRQETRFLYGRNDDAALRIWEYARSKYNRSLAELARVEIVHDDSSRHALRQLYVSGVALEIDSTVAPRPRSATRTSSRPMLPSNAYLRGPPSPWQATSDCFVLPTRGEGWGLPIAEAMSMALPAITTNHSGPSAFVSTSNGFPPRRGHYAEGWVCAALGLRLAADDAPSE